MKEDKEGSNGEEGEGEHKAVQRKERDGVREITNAQALSCTSQMCPSTRASHASAERRRRLMRMSLYPAVAAAS